MLALPIEDIESDLSAFHRIDDIDSMKSARFFTFAERLPAYGGVVAHRLAKLHEAAEQDGSPAAAYRGVARPGTSRDAPLSVAVKQDGLRGDGFMYPDTIEYEKRG